MEIDTIENKLSVIKKCEYTSGELKPHNTPKEIPVVFNMNLMIAYKSNNVTLIETYDGRFAVEFYE